MMKRFGVHNGVELATYAARNNLLELATERSEKEQTAPESP
jgi:hypothetical protein